MRYKEMNKNKYTKEISEIKIKYKKKLMLDFTERSLLGSRDSQSILNKLSELKLVNALDFNKKEDFNKLEKIFFSSVMINKEFRRYVKARIRNDNK